MRIIEPLDATPENFKVFGWLITQPVKQPDIENEYIRYWDRFIPFNGFTECQDLGFLICMKLPLICDKMEMLPNTEEAYICLDAEPAVLFVAPDANGSPDISKIIAFLLKGSSPVVRRGVWHWSPFPLTHNSNYIVLISDNCVILRKGKVIVNSKEVFTKKLKDPVSVTKTW